ncbi:MAG: sigma-70 family RNA polymerase sigma factor [Acidimicrobiaceae bacterium]|nr:sigma-70 family RNA polymerase sigma factor [Acidimicrobiaceae bacterium]MBT5581474.1 sigma-70 family RNA polymerase sigma factor [Acidimicrobiaceae bacterium]MBT5852301.1 sigma-70 family RNA polymerase sigma factor [Acidimicrobiaceae bacterium]
MRAADIPVTDQVATRFAGGDEAVLREAYDAHGSLVYSICLRSLPEDRAKDVTQEVFVSAWRARERFDPSRGSLAAWLVGITKNRIIDNVRSEQRHASRRSNVEAADTPVEPEVERIADQMMVAAALEVVPERGRTAIRLAYFEGLTHPEIAQRTGVALGTVKSDIRRGLEKVRRHMETSHV